MPAFCTVGAASNSRPPSAAVSWAPLCTVMTPVLVMPAPVSVAKFWELPVNCSKAAALVPVLLSSGERIPAAKVLSVMFREEAMMPATFSVEVAPNIKPLALIK